MFFENGVSRELRSCGNLSLQTKNAKKTDRGAMTEPQILLKNEKTQNDLNHIRTPQRYLRTTFDRNQRYLRTTFVQPSYISNPIRYLKVNLIQLRAMFA